MRSKPKIEKKFTGIDQSSERYSPYHNYNSLLRTREVYELKIGISGQLTLDSKSEKYLLFEAAFGRTLSKV